MSGKTIERGTYTVKEAAARLGIDPSTLHKLIKAGTSPVKATRFGTKTVIARDDVERVCRGES